MFKRLGLKEETKSEQVQEVLEPGCMALGSIIGLVIGVIAILPNLPRRGLLNSGGDRRDPIEQSLTEGKSIAHNRRPN